MSKDFQMCESSRECEHRRNELTRHETQRTISDWGTKTFGYPKNPKAIINRMIKEVRELEELSCRSDDVDIYKMADECADIYIVMCQVMTTIGFDLHSCVDHKMDINRARKWKLNDDGTGQHVKE